MSGNEFETLLEQYFANRPSPYSQSASEVVCLQGKNPDPDKIRESCQRGRCKHLATTNDLQDKGIIPR